MVEVFKRDYGYVATKDFESFYRGLIVSALAYRDFLATLPNAYSGVLVMLRSVDERGSLDNLENYCERWEVELHDSDVNGIYFLNRYGYPQFYELEDVESGVILIKNTSLEEIELYYNSNIRDRGLSDVKFEDSFSEGDLYFEINPKYVTQRNSYDLYEDIIERVELEFDDVIIS